MIIVKLARFFVIATSIVVLLSTIIPLNIAQSELVKSFFEVNKKIFIERPDFSEIQITAVRKAVFFDYLLPVIKQKNTEILKLREAISNSQLSTKAIEKLTFKYRLTEGATKEQMLSAIDIIPPSLVLAQAANESNWGRSRFAEDFNNYFGLWCFSKGCGTVPKNRDKDAKHEVAIFDSLEDSVDYYILNLNRNQAYKDLRAIRKQKRDNNKLISGLALAKGLTSYAQTGKEYIASIRSIIRYNKLLQYDL